jgi:hypothetical protein
VTLSVSKEERNREHKPYLNGGNYTMSTRQKLLVYSSLFIAVIACSINANDHKYRVILQGIDYPTGVFEMIIKKYLIRTTAELAFDEDYYNIQYEAGIGILSINKPTYSLVPSLSYIGENFHNKYYNYSQDREMTRDYYKIGMGLNVAFYWYWQHLLLGGYLPFRTIFIRNENNDGVKTTCTFDELNFRPEIMIGICF